MMAIMMILGSLFAASFGLTYVFGERLGKGFVALCMLVSLVPAAWGMETMLTGGQSGLGDYGEWAGMAFVVASLLSLFPVMGWAVARHLLAPKKVETEPGSTGFTSN